MGMIKPINSENSNQKKLKIDGTTVKVDKSMKKNTQHCKQNRNTVSRNSGSKDEQ